MAVFPSVSLCNVVETEDVGGRILSPMRICIGPIMSVGGGCAFALLSPDPYAVNHLGGKTSTLDR